MRIVHDRHRPHQTAPARLVLLPPARAGVDDLLAEGFVDAIRQRGLPLDVTLAEVGYQQVLAGTVARDLRREIVAPAHQEGCRAIWLAGISLGGFNALDYAAQHAEDLAGLVLLAPYPGTADILDEIRQAGGPHAWAADPAVSRKDERLWWHWLWSQAPHDACPVHLGLASEDRFIAGQTLLSSLIPAARVHRIRGDHSWAAWKTLWQHWLDSGLFDAGAQPS